MEKTYELNVAGLKRYLPLCPISDNIYIAAFVMFSDVELTCRCAEELLRLAPEHDILITAESKGIPLTHEMARQSGNNDYVVARKGPKLYMKDVIFTEVNSITTETRQILCIGAKEADLMRGKRVLVVDDVISTGESLTAIETLVRQVGGTIAGKMAVLAEGDAVNRNDITYLAELPLFDSEGNTIK